MRRAKEVFFFFTLQFVEEEGLGEGVEAGLCVVRSDGVMEEGNSHLVCGNGGHRQLENISSEGTLLVFQKSLCW